MTDLQRFLEGLATPEAPGPAAAVHGRVTVAVGTRLQAQIPQARIGELVSIDRADGEPMLAEIVGFADSMATLMPFGTTAGIAAHAPVRALERPLTVATGDGALGRVLDALGAPLDGGPPVVGDLRPVRAAAPDAMARPRIRSPMSVGVRALDGLLTLAEGQRVGIFASAGVGKSQLLAQCARQTEADVFVVALVGERGRELREFIDGSLGAEGLARGVVVCATSDAPPLMRQTCAWTALTHAEAFRSQGKRVLLLMDSLTRFARAGREVGLSAGEAPVRRGYPASVFAAMPPLLERCGLTERGSITALCTVLVEGDDLDEPIADELRGLLDGHVVLSRELAARGHFPAVDVPRSLSRNMAAVTDDEHQRAAATVRTHLSTLAEHRDLVTLGAYKRGQDAALDEALARRHAIDAFLRQDAAEACPFGDTVEQLQALVR